MKISVKQYIESLFDLFPEDNQLEKTITDLEEIKANFLVLKNFLENPNYSLEEKRNFLIKQGIEEKIINFLFILVKNKDINKLENIILGLKKLRNKLSGSVEVKVQTANELNQKDLENIKKTITAKLDKKIILSVSVNPTLLGGIILKINDTMIDNSLKNKLNILKNELVK